MVWKIVVNGVEGYTRLFDPELVRSADSVNYFKFASSVDIDLDSTVDVYYNEDLVLTGYLVEKEDSGKIKHYTVYEKAYELKAHLVTYNGNYRATLINMTIDDIVDVILADTSWVRASSDTTVVPSVSFEYIDALSALYKLLVEMQGKIIWFTVDTLSATDTIGTGDGNTTTFDGTLSNIPVKRGSVIIRTSFDGATVVEAGRDDGYGNLVGEYISSGTIDYDTGNVSVTFTQAPSDTQDIEVQYDYESRNVYFGTSNSDYTSTQISYINKSVRYTGQKPSKIVVLGAGDGINQLYAERGSGFRVKRFVFKDLKTQEEVDAVADALYQKYVLADDRIITLKLKPEYYYLCEGDLINIDGENFVVYNFKLSDIINVTCNRPEITVGKTISDKLRGIEPQGYFAQGVTNVANFGGYETAVDNTHTAIYRFYLPDDSVGMIRVNEAFINVYGKPYRVWHKGAKAKSTGENETPVCISSSSGLVILNDESEFKEDITICSLKPSESEDWNEYDVNMLFAYVNLTMQNSKAWDTSTWVYAKIVDGNETLAYGEALLTSVADEQGSAYDGSSITLFWAGKKPKTDTFELQVYVDDSWSDGERINAEGWLIAVSGHDHGSHSHSIEPGIYETDQYPSDVSIYINGTKVATYPNDPEPGDAIIIDELAGGSEFSVLKIDIKDHVVPGENVVEVYSNSLGIVQLDGFYRIFIETSK